MSDTTCCRTTMRKATRRLTALYDATLAPVGISLAQLSLLRNIRRAGTKSVGELGRVTELDRSTIGRNVRVLTKANLTSVCTSGDGRETIVTTSPLGEDTLTAAVTAMGGINLASVADEPGHRWKDNPDNRFWGAISTAETRPCVVHDGLGGIADLRR